MAAIFGPAFSSPMGSQFFLLWRACHSKKNWLFIGHPEAGWRSAVIHSVIVSCRRVGIDPWEYWRDVLRSLPSMKQSEIRSILPAQWKPASVPPVS